MGLDYVGLLSPVEVFALPKTQNALSSVLLDITVGQKQHSRSCGTRIVLT